MTRLVESPDIFSHSTFCDDIRFEVDGKLTLVGIYTGVIFVRTTFPVSLPKFGIYIEFVQRREVFDPNLSLRIFMPGDPEEKPSIEVDMTEMAKGAAQQAARLASRSEEKLPFIGFHSPAIFAPFTISQEGTIRLRILRRDELHRAGSIRVVAG